MNHIKIYKEEVTDLAWDEYSNMPHAEVCEDYLVFYTVSTPNAITAVCAEFMEQSELREAIYAELGPDYDQAFEVECTQRELAEQLISLLDD